MLLFCFYTLLVVDLICFVCISGFTCFLLLILWTLDKDLMSIQVNVNFLLHRFKIKYHPEESVKRKEEQLAALKVKKQIL